MAPRRINLVLASSFLLACAQLGCGGRAAFDGSTYRDGNIAFTVPPAPDAWRKIRVPDASLAFRDDGNDASVLVNARCSSLDRDTPLAALTSHLLIGTTERDVVEQAVEPFDGREAMHTRVTGKVDGVARAFDLFVLKKDGCVYDFVYVAPVDRVEAGVGAFQTFARGFRTLRGSGAP